jgi:hypothetical protein
LTHLRHILTACAHLRDLVLSNTSRLYLLLVVVLLVLLLLTSTRYDALLLYMLNAGLMRHAIRDGSLVMYRLRLLCRLRHSLVLNNALLLHM